MAESSTEYHEPVDLLQESTMEQHRGIVSLLEELEAIDWYQQRIDASVDEELAEILAHNRDEEKEHAAMSLEWLRRRDPVLDRMLREYLFSEGPIAGSDGAHQHEGGGHEPDDGGEDTRGGGPPSARSDGSLGIGSLEEES